MNKKMVMIVLTAFVLLTMNFSVAHEVNNVTDDGLQAASSDNQVIESSTADVIQASTKIATHIDVESNTTFDRIGDNFEVKLLDSSNNTISNAKVTFSIGSISYNSNTNGKGIAFIPIDLADGSYKVIAKFTGNSKYQSCSKTTWITVNNTRIVGEGLSNGEIQSIIDNAKVNNVILFKGASYDNINLVINKRLNLISKSNIILKSSSNKPVISINGKNSSSTTVKGFDIQGIGNAIEINDASHVSIVNNEITSKNNGIVASNANYLNITKNKIVKNSNNGIVLALCNNSHVSGNIISNNGENGILLTKSDKVYIYSNTVSNNGNSGIYTSNKFNGVKYDEGPKNLYITDNTINKNRISGIAIIRAGDNVNINLNNIEHNLEAGISINNIGSNKIQSNVISDSYIGIDFNDEYVAPKNQKISYNAIYNIRHVAVEAKDTYFYDNGHPLKIGENWYTDDRLTCPKVSSNNLKFVVNQVGSNLFQASFLDSDGNIASLLPDRELTFQTNDGQVHTITVSGGNALFTVDAEDGDLIKATVDDSHRNNNFQADSPNIPTSSSGKTPTYNYPSIDYGSGYGGEGNGNGNGQGHDGDADKGNGDSKNQNSDSNGNSTHSQNMDPTHGQSNQPNSADQSYDSSNDVSQSSASKASNGDSSNSGSQSQSVVKQITIDEDDIVRISGISLIVLLIILTIGFYYRDDIKEMKSKM